MNESEVNLIENSLYANPNVAAQRQQLPGETPPPLPDRPDNLEDDYNPANDSGVDTLRSVYNGYASINDRPARNRVYEEIHQTPIRNGEEPDPYQLAFNKKVQMFNERSKEPENEVWIKRKEKRNSVPDLYSKVKKAPLASQEVNESSIDWTQHHYQEASHHNISRNIPVILMVYEYCTNCHLNELI